MLHLKNKILQYKSKIQVFKDCKSRKKVNFNAYILKLCTDAEKYV